MHDPIFLDILGVMWLYVPSIITPTNLVFHPFILPPSILMIIIWLISNNFFVFEKTMFYDIHVDTINPLLSPPSLISPPFAEEEIY